MEQWARREGEEKRHKETMQSRGLWGKVRYDLLGGPGLHLAYVRIIKHNMKYSLLLPPDTGFIFAEGKPLRRLASKKVNTQQSSGRLGKNGQGVRLKNATGTVSRGVTGEIKRRGRE